ncbi:MAG: fumarylacetoacetate hydrolase family protein [Ignavibacteriae bacterium]|nr:fumarylacetoacetate hydrolase family protein [Ignavibacteriota bacterium]
MKSVRIRNKDYTLQVSKIFCMGRNYLEHAREMRAEVPDAPVVFMKPSAALLTDGEDIVRPPISKLMHFESELVVAIGKTGSRVSPIKAREYILGYGIGLDMTLRDVQDEAKRKGLPWTTAKGFDTSAPISEIIPVDQIINKQELDFECRVNSVPRQRGSVKNMIFSPEYIISFLSFIFTLEEGDLIFTGTPEGVGEVNEGDIVEAELLGYTKITHKVKVA